MDNNDMNFTTSRGGAYAKPRPKRAKWIFPLVLIILAVIILSSTLFTVQEDEIALVIRFGANVVNEIHQAGLNFKIPFIDDVRIYPKSKIIYNVLDSSMLTSDTIAMIANSYVVWRIEDPVLFFRTVSTISTAQGRLNNSTFSALQRTISGMTQHEIISAYERGRDNLNQTISNIVRAEALEYGVGIVDIKIRRFDLPAENEQAVFSRMISDRDQLAERFRADGRLEANLIKNEVNMNVGIIVSDARAEAERIIAEGEAEYMRILSEAYNTPAREEFFLFLRGLEFVRESLSAGEDNTVILDADSALAQILTRP